MHSVRKITFIYNAFFPVKIFSCCLLQSWPPVAVQVPALAFVNDGKWSGITRRRFFLPYYLEPGLVMVITGITVIGKQNKALALVRSLLAVQPAI